jgi:hypothetical protein
VEVRYCDGFSATIAVLIRKPGYVNCMTSFRPSYGDHSTGDVQEITCPMQTVQEAAAKAARSRVTPAGLVAAGDRRDAAN